MSTKITRPKCKMCKREPVKRANAKYCSLVCSNRARGKPKVKKVSKSIEQKVCTLSRREQSIVSDVLKGTTQRQAGLNAGIPRKSVDSQVSDIMKRPKVAATLREIFIESGFTDKHYTDMVFEGSKCMKSVGLVVHGGDREGNLEGAHDNSKSFVDVPDWATRRDYLKMGVRG